MFTQDNTIIEYHNNAIPTVEYINKINKSGTYSGELEIFIIISNVFNVTVYVEEYIEKLKGYRYLYRT